MNIVDVMQQISDRAGTIADLNCFPYPPDKLHPPAFEVNFPEPIDWDETYGGGKAKITLTANLLMGRQQDRSAWKNIGLYVGPSGAKSIKAVLESGTYTAFDTLLAKRIEFAIFPVAENRFLGAEFTLQITGPGS